MTMRHYRIFTFVIPRTSACASKTADRNCARSSGSMCNNCDWRVSTPLFVKATNATTVFAFEGNICPSTRCSYRMVWPNSSTRPKIVAEFALIFFLLREPQYTAAVSVPHVREQSPSYRGISNGHQRKQILKELLLPTTWL